jgi:serine/threonine-protein kinase
MGLGAAGLIVGTVWSLRAKSTYDQSTMGPCTANDVCTQMGLDERSSARTMATQATVAMGIGAVAMASGAIVFFTAPRRAGSVSVTPVAWSSGGSVTMSGAF